LDSEWNVIESFSSRNPNRNTNGDRLARVIYSSGPGNALVGAMNTHRSIVNRLPWMQDVFHLDRSDTVLQKTPCNFDVSVWEFFWPLITDALLVLAPHEGHFDSAYLAQLIQREQVTTVQFVPSMLEAFLNEPDLERECQTLRRVICSGGALSRQLQAFLRSAGLRASQFVRSN
jgi:non-ribosomal peptide synthetase component F